MAKDKNQPPANNELELSLFGPGIGECGVLHLGDGKWCVVDSCRDENHLPVALSYLQTLGVNVAVQVQLIVVSRWHDDHIDGVSDLLREAKSARFVCSAALNCKEFCTLLAAGRAALLIEENSGVSEMRRVLEILGSRRGSGGLCGPDVWAAQGTSLYKAAVPFDIELAALSPSAQTITDAKHTLASLLPKAGQVVGQLPSMAPNDLVTVLRLETACVNLLLGADMEVGEDKLRGWRAIIEFVKNRPTCIGRAYKIAHHGSENADIDDIWNELLHPTPTAVLTPYGRGKQPRPSSQDIARITRHTSDVYCTVWPAWIRAPRRHKSVDRTMRECTTQRHAIRRTPGHIRLRFGPGRPVTTLVQLFDGARLLSAAS